MPNAKYRQAKTRALTTKLKLTLPKHGYPDDDFFYLKFFDVLSKTYVCNPKSHRKID